LEEKEEENKNVGLRGSEPRKKEGEKRERKKKQGRGEMTKMGVVLFPKLSSYDFTLKN